MDSNIGFENTDNNNKGRSMMREFGAGMVVGAILMGGLLGWIDIASGPQNLDGPIVITKAAQSFWAPLKVIYHTDKGVFESKNIKFNVGDTVWIKK